MTWLDPTKRAFGTLLALLPRFDPRGASGQGANRAPDSEAILRPRVLDGGSKDLKE